MYIDRCSTYVADIDRCSDVRSCTSIDAQTYVAVHRSIKTPTIYQKVENLSGGNQQKVVLSKWLVSESEVFILDEPTNGIDVGAKEEIYELINDLASRGNAILFISSYIPELMSICDRILVMREGTISGEVTRDEFSEEKILSIALKTENNKVGVKND